MIQNIFIFKAGIALVDQNFGQCHALGNDINLISSYLYAIQQLSLEITGTSIKSLNFEKIAFHFYRDPYDSNMFYVVVTDVDDDLEEINFKIHRIAEIFEEKYKKYLQQFHGNIAVFRNFGDILVSMNIAERSCGGGSECEGCEHKDNFSEISKIIEVDDD